jgi:O-antigen ligase
MFSPALALGLFLLPMLPKELGPSLVEGSLLLSGGRVVLLTLVVAWLARRVLTGAGRFRPTPLAVWLVLGAVLLLPAVVASSDVRTSVLSFISTNVEYYLVFFLATSAVISRAHARHLAAALVLCGVTLALIGIFEAVSHTRVLALLPMLGAVGSEPGQMRFGLLRVQATLPHSIFLGAVQAMVLPLAVYFALEARTPTRRIAALSAVALTGMCLVLTVSRGAWLAALLAVALQVVLVSRRHPRYLWVPYVGLAALIGVAVFAPAILDAFGKLWAALFERQSSAEESLAITYRLALLRAALNAVELQPWTGHGLNTFLTAGLTRIGASGLEPVDSADNYYLMALVEGGIPGLLGFVVVMLGVLVYGWRAVTAGRGQADYGLRAALFGAIVGFIFLNATVGAYRVPQVSYTFWALSGVLLGLGTLRVPKDATR